MRLGYHLFGLTMMMMVAAPAAAADADRFDLLCTAGKSVTHYRVDLIKNEACEGACARVWKMGEQSSGELRLIYQLPNAPTDLEEVATVNRVTGEYNYRNKVYQLRPVYKTGACERATFTGFPETKF